MVENRTDAITALLARAGAAHGMYEQEVLNGVYDENWFGWYAKYVVEHGIGALLGREPTVEDMIAFFKRISAEHKASGSNEAWTSYYARALVIAKG